MNSEMHLRIRESVKNYPLRLPESLYKVLEEKKWQERKSVNRIIVEILEEKLADSLGELEISPLGQTGEDKEGDRRE